MYKKQHKDFNLMTVLIVVCLSSLGLLTVLMLFRLTGTHIPWMGIASSFYNEAVALVVSVTSGLVMDKEILIDLICGFLKQRGASKKEATLTLYANSIREGALIYIYKGVIKLNTLDAYKPIAFNPMANSIEDQHRECFVSFALNAGGYMVSLSSGHDVHGHMHVTISDVQDNCLNADRSPLLRE